MAATSINSVKEAWNHPRMLLARRVGYWLLIAVVIFFGAQACFFLGMLRFFGEQRFAILFRYLVVVGVDFAEGQEAVAVPAKVDKCRLQRWFYPGYLGKIDIALDLLVFCRFEIELFNPVALDDRHPCFFRVARVDQHARCH